jgi:hypothetical protein
MIATSFADAPAGVLTPGGPDVRPAAGGCTPPIARPRYAVVRTMTPFDLTGTAVAAPTAPLPGTGLPSVGARPPFGTPVAGTGVAVIGTDAPQFHKSNQRTTLGIHSPGRPQS